MTRRLLTGATVWADADCRPRPARLLVEDDRVAAIGDEDQPPPAADQILDLMGRHVLPGFVDVHLHLSQAAWFPHGGDGLGWGGLADAVRVVRAAADADPDAPGCCSGTPPGSHGRRDGYPLAPRWMRLRPAAGC